MGGDGGTQASRWSRESRDASEQNNEPGGQQHGKDSCQPNQQWQKLREILGQIKDDLTKEEEETPRHQILIAAQEAIRHVEALSTRPVPQITQEKETKAQLNRIKAGIIKIQKETRKGGPLGPGVPPVQGQTWAAVAAQAARTVNTVAAPQRATVRVRLEEPQGQEPGELLKTIQRTIPSAYAVRTLNSGDVDVYVPSQTTKDQILNGPDALGIKILRKDYLLEVPGVPLKTPINSGRNADNSELTQSICEATKRLAPGIAISRIRWLHAPEAQAKRQANPSSAQREPKKTRGTLIIGVPTQAIQ
jgi:hypothetical protein